MYTKKEWINNETIIMAEDMNKIETAIEQTVKDVTGLTDAGEVQTSGTPIVDPKSGFTYKGIVVPPISEMGLSSDTLNKVSGLNYYFVQYSEKWHEMVVVYTSVPLPIGYVTEEWNDLFDCYANEAQDTFDVLEAYFSVDDFFTDFYTPNKYRLFFDMPDTFGNYDILAPNGQSLFNQNFSDFKIIEIDEESVKGIQIARATDDIVKNFVGKEGQMLYNKDTGGITVHDGVTKGGSEISFKKDWGILNVVSDEQAKLSIKERMHRSKVTHTYDFTWGGSSNTFDPMFNVEHLFNNTSEAFEGRKLLNPNDSSCTYGYVTIDSPTPFDINTTIIPACETNYDKGYIMLVDGNGDVEAHINNLLAGGTAPSRSLSSYNQIIVEATGNRTSKNGTSTAVPAGLYKLVLVYEKDSSANDYDDCVFLLDFTYTEASEKDLQVVAPETIQIKGLKGSIYSYIGANRELTVDMDDFSLSVHDGRTRGGHKIGGINGISVGEGSRSIAINTSDALGVDSLAVNYSLAQGDRSFSANSSTANGENSFTANRGQAHEENSFGANEGRAYGFGSFATSLADAKGKYQTAIGKYNTHSGSANTLSNSDYAFVVGNGSGPLYRSNAMSLTWDGVLNVAKEIKVNGMPIGSGGSSLVNICDGSANGSLVSAYSKTQNFVPGVYSVSIGLGLAEGDCSFAVGDSCEANGEGSFAGGFSNFAMGNYSHVVCGRNEARGTAAFAEGWGTMAKGDYSHVGGRGSTADGYGQVVLGQWNIASGTPTQKVDSDYVFIIGNGDSSSARSNAMTLTWDGTLDVKKGITVNGQPVGGSSPFTYYDSPSRLYGGWYSDGTMNKVVKVIEAMAEKGKLETYENLYGFDLPGTTDTESYTHGFLKIYKHYSDMAVIEVTANAHMTSEPGGGTTSRMVTKTFKCIYCAGYTQEEVGARHPFTAWESLS